jgi:pimeloyl-ACP methyl ester carboxylesterase
MEWLEDYIVANGLRQHFMRTGGNKPVLILLHGFTDSGRGWLRLARALEAEFDVIMPDARGHGLSGGPEDGYSPEILMEDTAAFICEMGLEKPFLMGHSNGALTAAGVAAKYPELVKAIVVEDPPWGEPRPALKSSEAGEPWPGFNAWYTSWIDWHKALRTQTPEERIANSRQFLSPGALKWPREELLALLEGQAQFNLDIMKYAPLVPDKTPWRDTVEQIECPMLLLAADAKNMGGISPETVRQITAGWRNPRSRYVSFEGVGHFIHLEMQGARFEELVQLIKTFLQEN